MDSQIVKTAKEYRTIVAYAGEHSGEGCKEAEEKEEQLHAAGVETVIHLESPVRAAIFPSAVMAYFMTT